jgi:hypothetical protein
VQDNRFTGSLKAFHLSRSFHGRRVGRGPAASRGVREALSLCDRAYVLFDGRVLAEGTSNELVASEDVRLHFLGETFAATPALR